MVRREKVEGIVVSRREIGEADRLITLFTRERGLLKVVAKGVRKVPSRRGGHSEPYTQVLALLSSSRDRLFLSAVETKDYFKELHASKDCLVRVQVLGQLMVGLFEESDAQPFLFDAFCDACRLLPRLPCAKRDLLEVTVIMTALKCGGVMPWLGRCAVCGKTRVEEAVVLDASHGGWVCLSCSTSLTQAVVSVTARGLAVLRFVVRQPAQALKVKIAREESRQIIEAVYSYVGSLLGVAVGGARVHNLR